MAEVERLATRMGRSLITLDTRTGDTAEPLYASLGYKIAGVIPGYCRDPFEERLDFDDDHVQDHLRSHGRSGDLDPTRPAVSGSPHSRRRARRDSAPARRGRHGERTTRRS